MMLILTQPEKQAARLAGELENYQTRVLPLTRIEALPVSQKEILAHLRQAEIIICTSPSVIPLLPTELPEQALAASWFTPGSGTARGIYTLFAIEAFYPLLQQNSEALVAMEKLQQVAGKKVLLLTGVGGRRHIEDILSSRHAQVHRLELYKRHINLNSDDIKAYCTPDCLWLVSSAEALARLKSCDTANRASLLVTSKRLALLAGDYGYNYLIAASNKPADIVKSLKRLGGHTA